ncbi:diguanylate cyclase [Nisaea acidiphila]|uniref:diguanylate cyclase n=1 Tax=Nisaea acidiphila TaxID=1862145 RepID=A0A9J7AN28_9PROT|nr:diguanylate cyclase [Nisaea acidiphila]UUX48583.1 diguanylate cyclase [Nisaea acidiphila]
MGEAATANEFSILVVDDAPENTMLLSLILKDQGNVTTALSGREAIDIALATTPDLILLDIQMPDLDGYDVIQALKGEERTRNIPVIFVTGLSDEGDEEKGLELGAIDYITKPFKPAVVKARVRNHLRLRDYALQLEKLNEELERLATTDPLTSAFNRRYFMTKLQDELKRSRRYDRSSSVLMLDIDHFKSINDTYGHDVGDIVLIEMVKVLENEIREFDTLARLGGEEFAILLPETNETSAKVSAVRLLDAVRKITIDAGGKPLNFTVSIGCSEFDGDYDTVEAVLKSADLALYEAKHSGRDRVVTKQSIPAA